MGLSLKIFLLTNLCLVSCIDPSTVILAFNYGSSDAYTSTFGFTYSPCPFISSKTEHAEKSPISIKRTQNSPVYETALSIEENPIFKIQFPMPDDGIYVLILQFAETIYTEPNKRVFTIRIGTNYIVKEDLDLYLEAGALSAYDIFIEFEIIGGEVYINGDLIINLYEKFTIYFVNLGIGYPSISALILIKGDCAIADNCNMCYDKNCIDCDQLTATCKVCISDMIPINGVCQFVSKTSHNSISKASTVCDNLCEICQSSEKYLCSSCYDSYYLVSNICLRSCPYGFSKGCSELTSILINSHFTGDFLGTYNGIFRTGISENNYYFFNSPEATDPIPAKNRGLYFSGESYIESYFDIYFSLNFSIGIWIWLKPSTKTDTFFKHGKDNKLRITRKGRMVIYVENESEQISFFITSDLSPKQSEWVYLSYVVSSTYKATTVNSYLNNNLLSTLSKDGYIYRDASTDNKILLGKAANANIDGFIYAFHLWNSAVSDFNSAYSDELCGTGEFAKCLWSCDILEWIDSGVATACDSSCTDGCTRAGSCNICNDPLCKICRGFAEDSCDQCVTNASGSPCSCDYSYGVSQSGFECVSCPSGCTSCGTANPYDCFSCVSGYFLLESWCLADNPNNYARNSCIVSYKFTKVSNVQYDSVNNYPIYMGNFDLFYPNYDSQDPWIIPYRGLYFNGHSVASLPQKDSTSNGILLGLNHTIDIWLMISYDNYDGTAFSFYTDYSYLIRISALMTDSSSYKYEVCYNLTNINGQSTSFLCLSSPTYSFYTWQRIILSYSYQSGSSLKLFVNDKMVESQINNDYFYYENYDYKAEIGNSNFNHKFVGYVYSLRLYNYAMGSVNSWSATSCGYPYCTENNDGLIGCKYTEFYNPSTKSCDSCSSYCLYGCARSGDICNLHQNPLCKSYDDLEFKSCELCKENSNNAPPCICADNLIYDTASETCKCSDGSQPINNQCSSSCIRYLQDNEIYGYFTSTFLKIIFEFSIAVDISELKCDEVFPLSTLAKFGSNYSCKLDSKKITIELGKDFAVRDEVVSLIKGSLKSGYGCGYTAKDLNVVLQYSAPSLSPQSIIDAPNTVLYNCQDLLISGQKSTGNLNSALEYKWSISSDPPLQSLSQFNTDFQKQISYFSIPRSALSTASITVTLSVKNILENIDTTSILIDSIPNGIAVNFDRAVNYELIATQQKIFAVGSISSCDEISELVLNWKLVKAVGNLTAVDEKSIWENQKWPSNLYIPAKSIPSYTSATFELRAINQASNIKGIGTLTISVLPASPIIQFSRTDGSADITQPFSIDASSSYDPNENRPLSFIWTCIQINSDDCSSLINDPYSSTLNVPENSLEAGTEYMFSLAVIADFSKGRQGEYLARADKSIKINTVNYYVPNLNIINAISDAQSSIISGNERLPLTASIKTNQNMQFSYQWSIKGGENLQFTTPLDQYAIAISQDSLNTGITYTLNLALYDGSYYSNFFYSFYTNSPPYYGSFDINPGDGIESDTIFKLEASGWIDEENDYPLTYSFGYLTDSNYAFINMKNQSSTYFTSFPYLSRSTLSVFVDVYDSLEALSRKIVNIKISKNKNLDQNELFLSSTDYVYSITSNPQAYPGTISDLCSSIVNRDYYLNSEFKETSDEDMTLYQDVVNSTLYWTRNLIEKGSYDSQSISTFANLLSMITLNPYLASNEVEEDVCDMINTITENIPDSQILLNEQAEGFFIAIDQSYQYNATSLVNKTDNLEIGVDTINNLSKLILSQMVINEINVITTDSLDITLTVMENKNLDNFQLVSNSKNASVTLPTNFSSILGSYTSESEVEISMTLLKSPNNAGSLSSAVVDFSIYDRQTNKKIEMNMTSSNILIEIPVWNIKSSQFVPECAYLDTTSMNWSTEGCKKQQIKHNSILCSCNHFTTFAAIDSAASTLINSNIGDTVNVSAWTSLNESNAIGLYFGVVTLIVYIILAIITYKKDKKEEKLEEEARKKMRGIPKKLEKIISQFDDDELKGDDKLDKPLENSELVLKKKSFICCKKKKKLENCNLESEVKEPKKSCWIICKKQNQSKNNEDNEAIKSDQEKNNSKETKNSIWKCCKKRPKNKLEKSEEFGCPDEVYVYSFSEEIHSENTTTEKAEETKMQKWFSYITEKHELFNILFKKVPQHPSLCRITLYFLVLIGQMFFIGMFYETSTSTSTETVSVNSTNSTNSTSSDYSNEGFQINYSWHDFWIMAWSSLLMIIITSILKNLFTEKEITEKMTGIQYLKIIKQNKIKRWIGTILAWGFMIYFLWSIALYAIQFDEEVSRVWVLNTGISYTVNILFTSVVKIAITAYVTMKLAEFVEKHKEKKFKENNEAEIRITDFQLPTSDTRIADEKVKSQTSQAKK